MNSFLFYINAVFSGHCLHIGKEELHPADSQRAGPQNYICGTDPGGGRGTGGSGGNNEYIYGKGTKQPEKRRRNSSDCADEPAL